MPRRGVILDEQHVADSPARRPNILVILADDLGYADLGCQGSPDVKTPHIDSLAADGVRCTAGYVTAPQCSPSRAGLLSGQYQQRFGREENPKFPLMLKRGGRIIPEHLRPVGYATAHYGKWHLGFSDLGSALQEVRESQDQMLPPQHGCDESFGYPEYDKVAVKGSDVAPARHAYDDRVFAREAVDFIRRSRGWPWFIDLALHAPDYSWAIVGDSTGTAGTILTRKRVVSGDEHSALVALAYRLGVRGTITPTPQAPAIEPTAALP